MENLSKEEVRIELRNVKLELLKLHLEIDFELLFIEKLRIEMYHNNIAKNNEYNIEDDDDLSDIYYKYHISTAKKRKEKEQKLDEAISLCEKLEFRYRYEM